MSEPPEVYFAVIFSSRRTGEDEDGYAAAAEQMEASARAAPGFLGMESGASSGRGGLTICYWESLDDIARWKADAEHLEAQADGRARWYERYEVRVARIERAYGFDRNEAKKE